MQIVIVHPDTATAVEWRDSLAERLVGARVTIDRTCEARAGGPPARYAVGWQPPAGFFDRHRALEAFFNMGAGVERLLRDPQLPARLPLFRLEDGGMGEQMVDYCVHEVLRLRTQSALYEAQQAASHWVEHPPRARASLRVGVFGYGVLGRQVATALRQLGYPVAAHNRTNPSGGPGIITAGDPAGGGIDLFTGPQQFDAFLARTDVLILLAPLTPATESLFGVGAFARLPRGAWLINVARGALIDDAALLAALDRGHLRGATLDVFRSEPLPADHPFWRHPAIRLTPHVSAPTVVADSVAQVADKIRRFADGQPVGGQVDRARGY